MGLANSSLEKHKEAVDNFKKALELEPDNESYKSNLQIAEDKVRDSSGDYSPQYFLILMSKQYFKISKANSLHNQVAARK